MASNAPLETHDDNSEGDIKPRSQAQGRRVRERELERKRARGEVSCAECRRLKLKCNKKIPCASCIRRGCHTICPNGVLAAGQGSRFVLANTDKLHNKLIQMSQRIRQLEDALQIAQSSSSKTPHPLLSEELLSVKSGVDALSNENDKETEAPEDEEVAMAFGTLAISEVGASRFIGRVGLDTLLMNEPVDETIVQSQYAPDISPDNNLNLPPELLQASRDFPFSQPLLPKAQLFSLISGYIPTYERATALAETYLENGAWIPRPIQREQIMEDLLPLLYKGHRAESSSMQTDEDGKYNGIHRMHNLALILAVFACGAATDLTQRPNNSEGMYYHRLALAALTSHSIMNTGASLETVQTVVLVGQYDLFAGTVPYVECAWKIISFGLILAASIGLHRDPAHWNMEERYIQRRRNVFWDIYALDKWKCLGTGRPSIFHSQEMDVEFPEDTEVIMGDDRKQIDGIHRWRHRLVKEIIAPLAEYLCLTRPVKFSEIMDFDRKVRDFPDPQHPMNEDAANSVFWKMRGLHKDIALLFIHRNFFARAMIKDSENPLRSPFAPSFLAAYASAIKLLRTVRTISNDSSEIIIRLWPVWAHCLTSAVIIGSVASKIKLAQLATSAFLELNNAIALFQSANRHPVAMRGLPILLRLRERASVSLQRLSVVEAEAPSQGMTIPKVEKDEAEELNILRGVTRLVHEKRNTADSCTSGSQSQSNSGRNTSTPESISANATSPSSPMQGFEFSSFVKSCQPTIGNDVHVIPSGNDSGPGATSMPSSQSFPSAQTSTMPLDPEIESLLNMMYSKPGESSGLAETAAPNSFDPRPYDQQTQKLLSGSPEAPLPQYDVATAHPQIPVSGDIGSSGYSSSSWTPMPTQLRFMPSAVPSGPTLDPSTEDPLYGFEWLHQNDLEGISRVSSETAQFVSDWRFQASLEGFGFLSDTALDKNTPS